MDSIYNIMKACVSPMRPSIEERMNRQIEKAGIYNGMFDAGVTAVETATSGSAVQVSDNQYTVTSNALTTEHIQKAIENTHSLSEIMKESLTNLSKEYENKHFKSASKN